MEDEVPCSFLKARAHTAHRKVSHEIRGRTRGSLLIFNDETPTPLSEFQVLPGARRALLRS